MKLTPVLFIVVSDIYEHSSPLFNFHLWYLGINFTIILSSIVVISKLHKVSSTIIISKHYCSLIVVNDSYLANVIAVKF